MDRLATEAHSIRGDLLWLFCLALAFSCHTNHERTSHSMPDQIPFFEPIGFQLIDTPVSSREALAALVRTPQAADEEAINMAIEEARSWLDAMLQEAYQPPPETVFLAFPLEEGVCDVIRAVYSTDRYHIEIGQSRHMISITVSGFSAGPTLSPEQSAEQLARTLFVPESRIRFSVLGKLKTGVHGRQIMKSIDDTEPDWVDFMHWWWRSGHMSFLTLKEAGGLSMELITPEAEANRDWFSLYQ